MGWLKEAAAVAAAADGDLIVSSRRLAERFSEEVRKHSKAKSLSKVLYTPPRRSTAVRAGERRGAESSQAPRRI